MTELLLDTHIWLWFIAGSERLTAGLRDRIQADRSACVLSSISVWELGLLASRGRYALDAPIRTWVADACRLHPLREVPITREVALVSHEIELEHRDPADRLLAASALVFGLTLVTVDDRLTSRDWLPTLSE